LAKIDTTVGKLVDMIKDGDLRLLEMQRRYIWPATRVRDLLDSLYRGYPLASARASAPRQKRSFYVALYRQTFSNARREERAIIVGMVPNANRDWKAAMVRAGCSPTRCYDLVHSYCTQLLLQGGGDVSLVQKARGHRDIRTTLMYTQVVVDPRLAEALEKAFSTKPKS
jgi:integrase